MGGNGVLCVWSVARALLRPDLPACSVFGESQLLALFDTKITLGLPLVGTSWPHGLASSVFSDDQASCSVIRLLWVLLRVGVHDLLSGVRCLSLSSSEAGPPLSCSDACGFPRGISW